MLTLNLYRIIEGKVHPILNFHMDMLQTHPPVLYKLYVRLQTNPFCSSQMQGYLVYRFGQISPKYRSTVRRAFTLKSMIGSLSQILTCRVMPGTIAFRIISLITPYLVWWNCQTQNRTFYMNLTTAFAETYCESRPTYFYCSLCRELSCGTRVLRASYQCCDHVTMFESNFISSRRNIWLKSSRFRNFGVQVNLCQISRLQVGMLDGAAYLIRVENWNENLSWVILHSESSHFRTMTRVILITWLESSQQILTPLKRISTVNENRVAYIADFHHSGGCESVERLFQVYQLALSRLSTGCKWVKYTCSMEIYPVILWFRVPPPEIPKGGKRKQNQNVYDPLEFLGVLHGNRIRHIPGIYLHKHWCKLLISAHWNGCVLCKHLLVHESTVYPIDTTRHGEKLMNTPMLHPWIYIGLHVTQMVF